MRADGITKRERVFCIALLAALLIAGALYLAGSLVRQDAAQKAVEDAATTTAPGQTAHITGNSDGSDGIPWGGTMDLQVTGCTLYKSFIQAQAACDLGNIASEGQDENDPYLVIELQLSNVDAQARYPLIDDAQTAVHENGVNASIFNLQGDGGSYLPLSVMTGQPSFATWSFLFDVGETTTLRLGYSIPPSEKLSDPYLYVMTPRWRLQLAVPIKEGA